MASALSMSWPLRMPPSSSTSHRPCTASTTRGRAAMVELPPSSCRPPWLDTTSASAPRSTTRRASSGSITPLTMSLPFQRRRTSSRSFQVTEASNCVPIHCASDAVPMFCATAARLPKVRRLPRSTPNTHRGLQAHVEAHCAASAAAESTGRSWRHGAAVRTPGYPPSSSAPGSRPPRRGRSAMRCSRGPSSRRAGTRTAAWVAARTSSMEQMDTVLRQYGMPNASAARAAWISPSPCTRPPMPMGPMTSGIEAGAPRMGLDKALARDVDQHALPELEVVEVAAIARQCQFVIGTAIHIFEHAARNAPLRDARAGRQCC